MNLICLKISKLTILIMLRPPPRPLCKLLRTHGSRTWEGGWARTRSMACAKADADRRRATGQHSTHMFQENVRWNNADIKKQKRVQLRKNVLYPIHYSKSDKKGKNTKTVFFGNPVFIHLCHVCCLSIAFQATLSTWLIPWKCNAWRTRSATKELLQSEE